jgi:hypothetical protein
MVYHYGYLPRQVVKESKTKPRRHLSCLNCGPATDADVIWLLFDAVG